MTMNPTLLPLLLLLLLTLSTATPPPAFSPQCKSPDDLDLTSFPDDPTLEPNDPTFSDQTGPTTTLPPAQSPFSSSFDIDNNLHTICSRTDYPELCVSTILGTPISDAKGILQAHIRALNKTTWFAHEKAGMVVSTEDTEKTLVEVLEVCRNRYKEAMDDLEKAEKAVETEDWGSVGKLLSGLLWEYSSCGDEFHQRKMEVMMDDDEEVLMQMASICMNIAANFFKN